MYYLQSRYYNPEWGRFLNGDSYGGQVGGLLSHNIYVYCKNDSINMYDPNGYNPGNLFVTMNDAAKDAANYIGRLAFENRYEYATTIYTINITRTYYIPIIKKIWGIPCIWYTTVKKTQVFYTYKTVKTLKSSINVKVPYAPLGRKTAAGVHVHPNVEGYASNQFSPGDIAWVNKKQCPLYLYGPDGNLRMFRPGDKADLDGFSDGIVIFTDLPKDTE